MHFLRIFLLGFEFGSQLIKLFENLSNVCIYDLKPNSFKLPKILFDCIEVEPMKEKR